MVRRPPAQEDFLYWIMGQVNDTSSPYVHSVSYGDVEASIPLTYKTQVDMEFKKMGSLGRAAPSGVGRHWDAHRHTPASLANAHTGLPFPCAPQAAPFSLLRATLASAATLTRRFSPTGAGMNGGPGGRCGRQPCRRATLLRRPPR